MSPVRRALNRVLDELPEERLRQILDFAEYVSLRQEASEWSEFGRASLARCYDDDEPEYTEADLKPELNP